MAILALLIVISTFAFTQFMNSVTYGAILSPILVTLGVTQRHGAATRLVLPFVFTLGALLYAAQLVGAHDAGGRIRRRRQQEMLRSGLYVVGIPSAIFVFLFFRVLEYIGVDLTTNAGGFSRRNHGSSVRLIEEDIGLCASG